MKSGKAVNGRMFCSLVLSYTDAIRVGDPPCLISAMIAKTKSENNYILQRALEVYNTEMQKRIASYTPNEKGLAEYHTDSVHVALKVLKDGFIIDDEQMYEEKVMACFKDQFESFKSSIKKYTEAKCWEVLERIERMKIQLKIKNRKYCTPTGYDDYCEDIDIVKKQFKQEAGYLGSVAMSVWQDFLIKKAVEEKKVYKMVQESLDGKEGPERRNIKPLSEFTGEQTNNLKEEEDVEKVIRADIERLQRDGLQNIGKLYFGMLTSKIEELNRVKEELGRDNSYFKKLCQETAHWKSVFENATFNSPRYRRKSQSHDGGDSQATVKKESWNDVINELWERALEKSQSADKDNVKPQHGLSERGLPEGSETCKAFSDPCRKEGQSNPRKCNIS